MIKEVTAVGEKWWSKLFDRLEGVAKHIGFAVLGFFMARTSLIGGIAPLGAALAAGVPLKYLLGSAIGAVAGYFLPLKSMSSLKYIAALLAIVAIRFIISGLKGVGKSALWSGITAAVVVSGVGIAAAGSDFLNGGILGIAEGIISGAGAYFVRRTASIRLKSAGTSPEQTASLLITVNLVLMSLYPVGFDGISVGHILSFAVCLLSARYGRVGTASVCGVASALAVIGSGGELETALGFCIVAMLAGVFAGLGKVASAVSAVAVPLLWTAVTKGERLPLIMLAEVTTAAAVFLVLPKTVTAPIGTLVAPPTVTPDQKGLRRTLTMRLGFAAAALHGVSETVEDVARCLAISDRPNFASVLHKVENDACKGCSFHIYCWEKQRTATVDAALAMSDAVRKCRPVNLAEAPEEFTERCLRLERFEDSLSRHYTDFLSLLSAEKRVGEMRGVVSDQMEGLAGMLTELSEEFSTAMSYDIELAGRIAAALKELDMNADECSCVVDKFGRLTVEIRLLNTPEMPLNRARILQRIEEVCEREFEPPEINTCGRTYYITVTEKAVFTVDCGVTQFNQGKNQHCGDTCKYFYDGRGRLTVIVSDGMGSGGRAAVDSAMTAGLAGRLLKAGFGYDCTLRLVNSAMLYKSTDESLATLDISCIDLYSGKTEMLKAGAAPTIVRRNGRTGVAECKSLPAGILHEVGFDKAIVTLREDDILLMMSDGVCSEGTDWICAEVEAFGDGGAKQLADRIATAARRRRRDGHDDDITVFAAIIEKAV